LAVAVNLTVRRFPLYDGEGRLVRWNKKHEELTGYTAEEMAGMHVFDWYRGREPDTPRILQAVQDVMSKGSAEIETELITKSGKAIPFYFTGVGLTIAGKPYFTGIGIDITKRRWVETALKENSAFLNTLLNAIPVPVLYKDTEGRYIGFNEAFTEFYGKKYQELIGKTTFDLAPKDLAKIYHAQDLKLLQHSGTQVYESQVTDARCVVHDVIFHKAIFTDVDGQARGIIGVILDITERKRAEAEVRQHREHLEELVTERTAELRQAMTQLVQSEKLAATRIMGSAFRKR